MRTMLIAAGAGLALALAACGGDAPKAKQPDSVKVADRPPTTTAAPAPAKNEDRTRAGSVSISNEIARLCNIQVPAQEGPAPKFDFDSSEVDEAEKPLLQQVAKCFTTGPLKGRSMQLTGRADARGEQEYNMSLGAKRSGSVKGYLGGLGVEQGKMSSTSRGELDATGTDEAGYRKDRRVDIDLVK